MRVDARSEGRVRLSIRRLKHNGILLYSVLFAITALLGFSPLIWDQRSYLMHSDNLYQYFNTFVYTGVWLRDAVRSLFVNGRLDFPLWDHSLGMGADVITSLCYYGFGDPLNLISAIVPKRFAEVAFTTLAFVRFYLAGLFFYFFLRIKGKPRDGAIAAAIVYVWSGTGLGAVNYTEFAVQLVCLPLALIGVERICEEQKPGLFIISIFLCAISNAYAIWQLSILVAIYCIVRYFASEQNRSLLGFLGYVFKFLLCGICGVAMGGIIFVPFSLAVLGGDRMSLGGAYDPLYPISTYLRFPGSLIKQSESAYGVCGVALLGVFALFAQTGRRPLKITIAALTICLLLPAAGSFFNVFSYPTKRWAYGYSALLAYTLADQWPALITQPGKLMKRIAILLGAYLVLLIAMGEYTYTVSYISYGFLVISAIILMALGNSSTAQMKNRSLTNTSNLLLIVTIASATFGVWYWNDSSGLQSAVNDHVQADSAYAEILNQPYQRVDKISEDEEYTRFEQTGTRAPNAPMHGKASNFKTYWSVLNPYVVEWRNREMGLTDAGFPWSSNDIDSRLALMALTSTKYYVHLDKTPIPFGLRQVDEGKSHGEPYAVYENPYALPLGYTYDSFMTRATYEALDVEDRQIALLQTALVEDQDENLRSIGIDELDEVEIVGEESRPTITASISVEEESEKTFISKKSGATLELAFNGQPNSETYLVFEGFGFTYMNDYELYNLLHPNAQIGSAECAASTSQIHQLERSRWGNNYGDTKVKVSTIVNGNNRTMTFEQCSRYSTRYDGQTDFAVNLGYYEKPLSKATVTFDNTGEYSWTDLRIVCIPSNFVPEKVETLSEEPFQNIKIESNLVQGVVSLSGPKILCVAIPFDKGWSAVVNGETVPIMRVNSVFMGIPLEEGNSTIELHYFSHGLAFGLIAAACGWGAFIVMTYIHSKRNRMIE